MAAAAILDFWNREILLAIGAERVEKHQHAKLLGLLNSQNFIGWHWLVGPDVSLPNFVKIGRSVAEILHFFEFSRWPLPPSWIFEIAKFYWLLWYRGWRRISMLNFVKIGQSVAKILRFFFIFQDGGRRHRHGIFKIVNTSPRDTGHYFRVTLWPDQNTRQQLSYCRDSRQCSVDFTLLYLPNGARYATCYSRISPFDRHQHRCNISLQTV